jgi:hypothetical protein
LPGTEKRTMGISITLSTAKDAQDPGSPLAAIAW